VHSKQKIPFERLAVLLMVLQAIAIFVMACRLEAVAPEITGPDVALYAAKAMAEETRTALGAYLYAKADIYFHKGVEYIRKEAFANTFFRRVLREISPNKHVHLEGHEVQEIIPWLWLALHANPHDVELYLVTAFWLAHLGQGSTAHAVLRTGRLNNPGDYRLFFEEGRLYLHEGRRQDALRLIEAALKLWPGTDSPSIEEAIEQKRSLLFYKGLLCESDGAVADAVAAYNELLKISPQTPGIKMRLENLARETPSNEEALSIIKNLETEHASRAKCHREDHNHEDDEKHDRGPGGNHKHDGLDVWQRHETY